MKNILLFLFMAFAVSAWSQDELTIPVNGQFQMSQIVFGGSTWNLSGAFYDGTGTYKASDVTTSQKFFYYTGTKAYILPITAASVSNSVLTITVDTAGLTPIAGIPSYGVVFTPSTASGAPGFVSGLPSTMQQVLSSFNLAKSDAAYGEMSIDDTDRDTISFAATTPAKSTDWTTGTVSGFTYATGRLTYSGTLPITIKIDCSASIRFAEAVNVSGWIYKSGSALADSKFTQEFLTAGDFNNVNLSCITTLTEGQYIELFFAPAAHTGTDELIIDNANLNIVKIN